MYAAYVGSGVWRAKKNKALAAVARAEWRRVYEVKRKEGVGIWLLHVKGHSDHRWNDVADDLAKRGLDGAAEREYVSREVD